MKHFIRFSLLTVIGFALSYTAFGQQENTLKNLQQAYQAEANASRKYELFAKAASAEGYEDVADLFKAVSVSESIHMKNHKEAIKKLGGKPEKIKYEKVEVGTTQENLRGPMEGEKYETEALYPKFIASAKQEKADVAVESFTYAMEAEAQHEKLFEEALTTLGEKDTEEEDFYVSDATGETIEVSAKASPPKAKLKGEQYLKVN